MKVLIAVLFLALTACTERRPESPESAVPDESVFDPLTGTLDRARGVEDTILDSAEDRRRQIDEQTGVR
jgi:hypothetical protein